MTAEVAILNRTGVALAADSAVTIDDGSSQKVYSSATKIFQVCYDQSIAVMIYGSINLSGVPWETVIKLFRKNKANQKFNTVEE